MTVFHFQQFSVRQQASAMKVCTDATLFGAMMPLMGGEAVLDIGTGTGLLALMAAQLGAGQVTGVELDLAACREAANNFSHSPWHERLNAVHASIQHFAEQGPKRYDLIICNPPFFDNHSKSVDQGRRQARHTDHLPYPELLKSVQRLLADGGLFYLLLPRQAVEPFTTRAKDNGLYLIEQTDMRGHAHNPAKVSCLTFSRNRSTCETRLLTIYQTHRVYSQESEHYLAPFLLRFA